MKNPFSIFYEFIKKIINNFTKKNKLQNIQKEVKKENQEKSYILNQDSECTISGTIIFKRR